MTNIKTVSVMELIIVVLSVISFSYLVSTNVPEILKHPSESKFVEFITRPIIPSVSASQYYPSGCCLETKSGAVCQDMNLLDSSSCKSDLVGIGCAQVSECQVGCCYDQKSGICSMNSPKQKCETNGGNWSLNSQCNIAECQLGCCLLGDSVSMTTNRECTILSKQYNFEKTFLNLDSVGSCLAYNDLSEEGACLTPATDYSGKNDCIFTTKSNCAGTFKKGYLCTSEELNTNCQKTTDTSCFEGKDQIYFIDDCGNRANIYDASKAKNQSYWEKLIPKSESCQGESSTCGNCDYVSGSICKNYDKNKDAKPQYGDNVCRNLNCGERKHGESWCVYDVNPASGISPVGAGSYIAKCIENEISISSCASFNQEICAENRDDSYGFSEAKCLVNDWRACLNANDASSYQEVKTKCDQNPQCIMFNDLYGENNLRRSDDNFLAGFNPDKTNEEQGSIGDLGKDQNKVLAHCVPKFTPGFQFWSTNSNPLTNTNGQIESQNNYGGSSIETSAICSLGNFVCISKKTRDCTLAGGCDSWSDDSRNWECNSDGVHSTIKGEDLPALLSAMNERCRAMGSCGVSSNILGKINSESSASFSVGRIKIDSKGKANDKYDVSSYNLPEDYLSSLSKTTKKISSLKDLTSIKTGISANLTDSAGTTGNLSQGSLSLKDLVSQIPRDSSNYMQVMNFLGPLTLLGLTIGGGWLTSPTTSLITTTKIAPGVWTQVPSVGRTTITVGGQTVPVQTGGVYSPTGGSMSTTTQVPNSAFVQGLKSAGITIGCTIVGSYLGAQLGSLIAKNQGWSPGKQQAFVQFMGAVGSALGYIGGTALVGATLGAGGATGGAGAVSALGTISGFGAGGIFGGAGFSWMGFLGFAGLIAAIAFIIYEAFLNKYEEQEYFILQYTCGAWQPPAQGDCSVCNEDVRPCSEYKCRSLGNNCHYFNENGEPGYCASISEIWKASIKPWSEIISSEHKYSSITENSFKIEGKTSTEVPAWIPVTFGIITDKQAICKIGLNHSQTFDQMGTIMLSSVDPKTGKSEGTHHQITLSPSVTTKDYSESLSSLTTLPMETGENNYYIKCRNFAGQENEAPFTIRAVLSKGPDLTPPSVVAYTPSDNSYMKFGESNFSLTAYLNEPAECKYSTIYDYNSYAEMPNNMTCFTDANSGNYGLWPCFAEIENLTENTNQIFIKCLDQPNLVETELIRRIETPRSYVYNIKKCSSGLSVSITNPAQNRNFEGKDSVTFDLEATTTGCINGGESFCSFNVDGISSSPVAFLQTGNSKNHKQTISGLDAGNHSIFVSCIDNAGNTANASTSFTITYDNSAPLITRTYMSGSDLVLKTSELAECVYKYSANSTGDCDFGFENARNQTSLVQTLIDAQKGVYYIKCRDEKLNEPLGCTEIISVQ